MPPSGSTPQSNRLTRHTRQHPTGSLCTLPQRSGQTPDQLTRSLQQSFDVRVVALALPPWDDQTKLRSLLIIRELDDNIHNDHRGRRQQQLDGHIPVSRQTGDAKVGLNSLSQSFFSHRRW